jgi:hypothetical protein
MRYRQRTHQLRIIPPSFAFPLKSSSPSFQVTKDQMEVCPLSREVILLWLNPYPFRYKTAFAFSILPYPQPHRLALRLAFPYGRFTGLPRSSTIPCDDLDPIFTPVVLHLRQRTLNTLLLTTYFLVQAFQHL